MRPPSRAGNGKRFTTAKLTEIRAIKESSEPIPSEYACPANLAIPTGPESYDTTPPLPEKIPTISPHSETIIKINSLSAYIKPAENDWKNGMRKSPVS